PQFLDQRRNRDDLTRLEREQGEDLPELARGRGDGPAVLVRLQRAKDLDLHQRTSSYSSGRSTAGAGVGRPGDSTSAGPAQLQHSLEVPRRALPGPVQGTPIRHEDPRAGM